MEPTSKRLVRCVLSAGFVGFVAAAAIEVVECFRAKRERQVRPAQKRLIMEQFRRRVALWFPIDEDSYEVAKKYVEGTIPGADLNLDNSFHFFIKVLESAQKDLRIMVYTFSDPVLARLLSNVAKRAEDRPDVRIILDKNEFKKQHSIQRVLRPYRNELQIRVFAPVSGTGSSPEVGEGKEDSRVGYMHHKVVIVDDLFLAMGSLNFTYSAITRNQDGAMLVDKPSIVKKYIDVFEEHWDQSSEPQW